MTTEAQPSGITTCVDAALFNIRESRSGFCRTTRACRATVARELEDMGHEDFTESEVDAALFILLAEGRIDMVRGLSGQPMYGRVPRELTAAEEAMISATMPWPGP